MEKKNIFVPCVAKRLIDLFFGVSIVFVVSFIAITSLRYLEVFYDISSAISEFGMPVVILLSLLCVLIDFFGWFFVSYELQNDQIKIKKGIIWKSDESIFYHNLTVAKLKQGPLERLFGFASINLRTTGFAGVKVTIKGIKKFKRFQKRVSVNIQRTKLVDDKTVMMLILQSIKSRDDRELQLLEAINILNSKLE